MRLPSGVLGDLVPHSQRYFRLSVPLPERSEVPLADDVHSLAHLRILRSRRQGWCPVLLSRVPAPRVCIQDVRGQESDKMARRYASDARRKQVATIMEKYSLAS